MELLLTKYLKAAISYKDIQRLETFSVPSWTAAKLKQKHASLPFNPVIANVFFRAGEIEAWGRGVERIFAA